MLVLKVSVSDLMHCFEILHFNALLLKLESTNRIASCKQYFYNLLHISMDIMLRAFWRSCQYGHRWENGRVLLTGATGFLGAFILRDLLLHTKVLITNFSRNSSCCISHLLSAC